MPNTGAVVVTDMVSGVEPLLAGTGGLKLHDVPAGRLEQNSAMALGTLALTVKVKVAVWPCLTVAALMPGVMVMNSGTTVVRSLAVLLARLVSPPPETVAVLATVVVTAPGPTLTVSVIGG